MKRFLAILSVLTLIFVLAACENTENISDSEAISDPFAESTIRQTDSSAKETENSSDLEQPSDAENPTRALAQLLGRGGTLERFGYDEEPYEYNGTPITLPVTVTANEGNSAECSVGITCCINGVVQRLTSGDQVDKTMIIKENISPGETITFDIAFDPIVSLEDADNEKFMISFLSSYQPTFQATEEYIGFAGREAHISTYGPLNMKARPTNIIDPITDFSYEERISTSGRDYLPSFYRGDPSKTENIISYLNINKDKSLDFNVTASHLSEATYYAFILQNNEMVTFNGGKEYMKIDAKEKYEYDLDFHLDKAECGDAIECVFCQRINFGDDYDLGYVVQTTGACLVVREDFSV